MAIQHRRGKYEDFDSDKLVAGEIVFITSGDPASSSGRSVYVCFAPGVVKRFTTYEDFETEFEDFTEDIQSAFTEELKETVDNTLTATAAANTAAQEAATATAAANTAAQEAATATATANTAAQEAATATATAKDATDYAEVAAKNALSAAKEASDAAALVPTLEGLEYKLDKRYVEKTYEKLTNTTTYTVGTDIFIADEIIYSCTESLDIYIRRKLTGEDDLEQSEMITTSSEGGSGTIIVEADMDSITFDAGFTVSVNIETALESTEVLSEEYYFITNNGNGSVKVSLAVLKDALQISEEIKEYLSENEITGTGTVYMRVEDGYIQYSSDNENWNNVIAISELKGSDATVTTENIKNALGYTPADAEKVSQLSQEKVDKANITLDKHTDGLIYIFVDGVPKGNGIEISTGTVVEGDVIGTLDDDNNILLSGDLADGTYTLKYLNDDGTYTEIGTLEVGAIITHTITQNLTNVTSDNSVTSVMEGESFTATLTTSDDYTLTDITVTMGGTDITSTSYNNGVVNIANVTGDVVITAIAETLVSRTNFCVVDGDGWLNDGRCSTTGADRTDSTGYIVTNYIAVQNGDIIFVKNLDISTTLGSAIYTSDKTGIKGFSMTETEGTGYVKDIDLAGEWEQFTIDNENAAYLRICGEPSSANADIIVNIKRNGEWL